MDTIASLGYFFAIEEWQIYAGSCIPREPFQAGSTRIMIIIIIIIMFYSVAPLLDILHGTALATCFSLASKFFTEEDFGKYPDPLTLGRLLTAFLCF